MIMTEAKNKRKAPGPRKPEDLTEFMQLPRNQRSRLRFQSLRQNPIMFRSKCLAAFGRLYIGCLLYQFQFDLEAKSGAGRLFARNSRCDLAVIWAW